MKKCILPILVLLVLGISACKKDPTKTIIGKWQLDKATYTTLDNSASFDDTPITSVEYIYEKDGQGSYKYGSMDKVYSFQWYLSEDLSQITFIRETGSADSYKVETLSDDKLALSYVTFIDTTSIMYTRLSEYSKIGK